MSDRAERISLPYGHLPVVAYNNRELLFVNYGGHLPIFDTARLSQEVFEREPVDVASVCLEEAVLIINSVTAVRVSKELKELRQADEVGDQSRIGILAGALERRRMAMQLVHAANSTFTEKYTFPIDSPDDSDKNRKIDLSARDALIQRTAQFAGHPALSNVLLLKRLRPQGLPESVRQEAELTLRVMYDQASTSQQARNSRAA